MPRDVNRNPRRWTDRSRRVRVIEGWHPSQPDRIGYNVLVDGDWVGTFESVERAAHAARRQGRFGTFRIWRRRVALVPHLHSDNR